MTGGSPVEESVKEKPKYEPPNEWMEFLYFDIQKLTSELQHIIEERRERIPDSDLQNVIEYVANSAKDNVKRLYNDYEEQKQLWMKS